MSQCAHEEFEARVDVSRLNDPPDPQVDFHADVRINCKQCGRKFKFLGLPSGFRMKGAACSVNGVEARLAIEPVEE